MPSRNRRSSGIGAHQESAPGRVLFPNGYSFRFQSEMPLSEHDAPHLKNPPYLENSSDPERTSPV